MHSVDRGREPAGLAPIRKRLTPKWVRHYRKGEGAKPTDSEWRQFQSSLSKAFHDICGYCEEFCQGDVDHFRPKSRFPELVYEWPNWVLGCQCCNQKKKRENWPRGGYVDPCATSTTANPDGYFVFDTTTTEILPRSELSAVRRRRALQTINDLGLNNYHHLKRRAQWLGAVARTMERILPASPDYTDTTRFFVSREFELSSITRQFLRETGHEWDD